MNERNPYISILQGWRIERSLVNISIFCKWRNLLTTGRSSRNGNFSSSLQAAFLRVVMLFISTTIVLDAKVHHKYNLMTRYMISKKKSDSKASHIFQFISVVRFTIINTNLHIRGRERDITQQYSTSFSNTMFVTCEFTS